MKVEKTVSRLLSIQKLMQEYSTLSSRVKMTWDKLGELVFLKSQFWVLRTPKERVTCAKVHEVKAATFRELATEQHAGTSGQCPPPMSGVVHHPSRAQHPGQTQLAPQSRVETLSSSMLKPAGQPATSHLAQGPDMPMANPEGS
jgi:hypothetical protein